MALEDSINGLKHFGIISVFCASLAKAISALLKRCSIPEFVAVPQQSESPTTQTNSAISLCLGLAKCCPRAFQNLQTGSSTRLGWA